MERAIGTWLRSAALALVVFAIAGCGGSSGGPTSAEASAQVGVAASSPAVSRADAICRSLNGQLAATLPKTYSVQAVARLSPRNAVLERKAADELALIHPPTSVAGEWRQAIADRRQLAGELDQLARVVKSGDTKVMATLGRQKASLRERLLAIGRHIGFSDCQELG
jgi:hypothetical protein